MRYGGMILVYDTTHYERSYIRFYSILLYIVYVPNEYMSGRLCAQSTVMLACKL